MGKNWRSAAILIALLCCCLTGLAQSTTSKGTEFWTAYMDNSNAPSDKVPSTMVLYITSDVNTSGNVAVADGSFTQNFSVIANQITTLTMPASAFLKGQGTYLKGIHITAAKAIAVYAHIYADNSSGATLLLPVNTLGKDYYSINYKQEANETAYSDFLVVATEDNTTVEITPSAPLLDGKAPGTPYTIPLNKGDVYQGLANSDLTGTRIRSISSSTSVCSKIAVFSGSTRIQIGCNNNNNSSDNLFQQVYPTASWGKNYLTVPLKSRQYDIIRIVLSTPVTNVTLNGQPIASSSFIGGLYYQFNSQGPNLITADQPVQVAQYAVSQGDNLSCTSTISDVGDPEMIYLTPLEQTLNHVTLYSASKYQILNSYINVTIKTDAVPTFVLDGDPYTNFSPVAADPGYSYAQISVASGAHNISAGDGFNAIAYGFGVHESYGYAAGANLADLNSFVALQDPATKALQSNGCTQFVYNMVLTLPYQTTSIIWDPKDGTTPITVTNPVAVTVQKNNMTLYEYSYPKNPVSYPTGSYTMIATVYNPNSDICGTTQAYELDYNISDPPVASFTENDNCLGDATAFTDASTHSVAINSWLWDFGDGQTSDVQNPTHIYSKPGNYNVTLSITDVDNCTSVYPSSLYINAKPIAAFNAAVNACEGQPVIFTNTSTSTDGIINKLMWDFGDGTTTDATPDETTISHVYAQTGNYTAKLVVTTDLGCISDAFIQQESVKPSPVVDFAMPDVCLNDAYAQFTDKSTIADNTAADFTYLWDFGDPANTASPNTSTDKNPKHVYKTAAVYNVTLTVTSKYGCPVSKTQAFTVNGTNPVADFTVENPGNLCSANDVIFDDKSYVADFGNVTKLVWYFDYANNPNQSETYTTANMSADKKYHHNYGVFNTNQTKNYEVVLMVYSGSSSTCSNEKPPVTITLKPNPVISLIPVGSICQGISPMPLPVNLNGFAGTGTFSGPGITSSGLFDPGKAQVGVNTINYLFTAQNGCDYSTSEDITVIAAPVISADPVVNLLEGFSTTLNAQASGNRLTYKWTPSTGLNRDDILNPVASPTANIVYTLTATSADGCISQAAVNVLVLKNIVIPNAFTPNGDGTNDYWQIKYIENYPDVTVDVYNRYGQKVFNSIGYGTPWDGKYKGANLPAGTYYYIINPKHGRTPVSGPVSIIR